ncbi:MAG: vWA domain-containing protein [Solirubrobacteraceae bacterium]
MSEPLVVAAEGLAARVGELAGAMRAQGSRVGVGEVLAAVRCLDVIDPASRQDARLALRSVLCSTRVDLERFDVAFYAVFGDGRSPGEDHSLAELGAIEREALPSMGVPDPTGRPAAEVDPTPVPAAWSEVELLREKDFAHYTLAEAQTARDLIARLARRHPRRLSRRTRPSRSRGHSPDLRATVRESLRTGGEPLHRRWRTPTTRPRQLVLVCDVSGSMAPYARMLLQYMHACVAARRRVEAFAFGTRLTRITYELNGRDHDRALDRAAAAVTDFSGGTRIGAALAELNRVHGRRLGRGAAVVILSDGWDRGDPELLESEMARLRRAAHRLVWLNPLAAHPDYEPLTRGMRAAVPHTDELLAGNSLASLEQLAEILEEM